MKLFNSKKGFKISQFVIGFLVLSVVILAGTLMVGDLNNNYGDVNINDSGWDNTYNKVDEIYNLSQNMKGQTIDADISDDEPWQSMTKGSYSAFRLTKKTFSLSYFILGDIADKIPGIKPFIPIAMAALTLLVVFAIALLFLKSGEST